ncbi:MAG: hypothetical protein NVV62_04185 [Terricaulis sp.]|nr:hypothetical protein [Terricaulis sp.]
MLDKITQFVAAHKVTSAVIAGVGALAVFGMADRGPSPAQGPSDGGMTAPGSNTPGPSNTRAPSGTTAHEVIDPNGFAQPVRALTIPVPNGWQAESTIRWDNVNGQCSAGLASPHIRMTSGDRRELIEILPGYLVTTDSSNITNRGSQPGDFCVLANTPTGDVLMRTVILPRLRQGVRIDRIVSAPLTPSQQQQKAQMEQLAQASPGVRIDVYTIEAWLTHQDGATEVLVADGYALAYPQMIQGVPPIVLNNNNGIVSVRASSQQRVQELLQTARGLIAAAQWDPQWRGQVDETIRTVSAPQRPSSRGPRYSSGPNTGFDMDQWRRDQARDDRQQRDRIDSIREVERCYDPETGRTS